MVELDTSLHAIVHAWVTLNAANMQLYETSVKTTAN